MKLIETLRHDLGDKDLQMMIIQMDESGKTSVAQTAKITVSSITQSPDGESVDLVYNDTETMRFLARLVGVTRIVDEETGELKKLVLERNPGKRPEDITILNKIVEFEVLD